MPAASAVMAPELSPIKLDFDRLLGLIRQVRAECQNLQRSLETMKCAAAVAGPDAARAMVAACLANSKIFEKNRTDIEGLLRSIHEVLDSNPELLSEFGDAATEIQNRWDRIAFNWPAGTESTEDLKGRIATGDLDLSSIVYSCALRTIPDRLNKLLRELPVGKALDFHRTFVDELPSQEQRQNVLEYLDRQPKLVEGIVDPKAGQIFRVSQNPWRRRLSLVYFLIALGLPVPLVWIYSRLGGWFPNQGLPGVQADFTKLTMAYLALALGSLAHMAIVALKQVRTSDRQNVMALEDWMLWFHVKETPIVTGVLTLWFALVAYAITIPTSQWTTGFFVGYSLDSFVDLFLQRFETTASKVTETIKGQLLLAA